MKVLSSVYSGSIESLLVKILVCFDGGSSVEVAFRLSRIIRYVIALEE